MQHTFIPGKDAALEESIARFQAQLSKLGFNIEEASWLNPVPNVWSVHIRDRDCPLCFTNGKGATRKAALASALGEYFERLSTNYFFADFYLGQDIANGNFVHYPNEKWFPLTDDDSLPEGMLDDRLLTHYDPHQELLASELIDLQSNASERGICALPFTRQSDQETVYIPMNIIGNLYVSNGMSAGNTIDEARVQALSEIFERYVKNRIIAEALSLPAIPDAVMARYPKMTAAIETLQVEGFPIFAFDASLGGRYPVICVVLFNPQNGTCFASFGAHPDFGVALERTVTELLQGRNLHDLDVFSPPTFDNDEVADHTNLETHFIDSSGVISWDLFRDDADFAFVDWNFSGSTAQEFRTIMGIFQQDEAEVYIADYQHLGIYACRILVPGMSDIYPAEDLLLANNNMGASLREVILALPGGDLSQQEYLDLLEQLDEEGLDDFTRVRELLGIATRPDSGWHTLRIGELKSMLALAGGDYESAQVWAEWTLEFNGSILSTAQQHYYRCLIASLQLFSDPARTPESYRSAMQSLYGPETVTTVWQVIQREQKFMGLTAIDPDLHALPAHQALLATYEKLQRAKQTYWHA